MVFLPPNLNGGGIPTSYSLLAGSLPTGVNLNTQSGLLSGIVNDVAATYNCTIRATKDAANDDQPVEFVVS